jgi:hypothetical protein
MIDPSSRTVGRVLLLVMVLAPARGAAQEWWVDASAGRVSDRSVAAPVSSTGAALVLRRDGGWWGFVAGGAPFDSEGVPWAAAGAGTRVAAAFRGLPVGIDLAGRAFGYRAAADSLDDDDTLGGGVSVEALPFVAFERDGVRGELSSGVMHATRSDTGGSSVSRTLSATRARVSSERGPLALSGEARYWRASEAGYPYVGGAARWAEGRANAWAEGGAWLTDRVDGPAWAAGAGYALLPGTELYASVARETNDPLYRLAPRLSWSIGVSRRLGRAPLPPPAAVPVARAEAGRVTFRLPRAASATAPSLGGDFNGWRPVAMTLQGDEWIAVVPLTSGVYHYAFRVGGGAWFVPEGTPGRTDDGFGGVNAILVVP